METENWKETLKTQKDKFDKLQALDEALNDEQLQSDIDKVLQQKRTTSRATSNSGKTLTPSGSTRSDKRSSMSPAKPVPADDDADETGTIEDIYGKNNLSSPSGGDNFERNLVPNPMNSHSPLDAHLSGKLAPETADRYAKAKITMLEKQLKESIQLRAKMEEQVKDLQKQLNMEREEKKTMNKR